MFNIGSRKRAMTFLLFGTLVACGGGGTETRPPASAITTPMNQVGAGIWVIMGSSTATGSGASQGKGWTAVLHSAYASAGVQLANIAKGGTVTYEGLSITATPVAGRPSPNPSVNIDQALSRRPKMLIVSYPTNDTALGYSVDETVNNLLAIQKQALAAGVPVVITSTQPRNLSDSQLAQLRMIDERLANTIGACFIDLYPLLAGTNGRLAPNYDSGDGVHPNDAGHAVIAAQVIELIEAGRCVRV